MMSVERIISRFVEYISLSIKVALEGRSCITESACSFLVPSVSLDDFVRQIGHSIQFIKMDVEGAETSVLKGAVQTLRTFHPPMIVELHNDPSQKGLHPAIPLLEELGYEIEWLNEAGYRSHIFAHWIQYK